MSAADKALAACKEYDRLMTAIKRNTEEIGEGVEVCSRWVSDGTGGHWIPGGGMTHLTEAFTPYESMPDYPDYSHINEWNDEPAALEIIGECTGCLRAYNAVQERKANRKKIGAVKRTIRMIGRKS